MPGGWGALRGSLGRQGTAFGRREACGAELVVFGFDSSRFGLAIAANDASAHHQLQAADTLQQEGPVHGQFDRAAGRQQIVGFKQDATAADVERAANS